VAAPDGIVLKRDRDLEGRDSHPWIRRVLLGLFGVLLVLGLADVFGQATGTTHAATPRAELSLSAPTALRGGLLYTARFEIYARAEIKKATLVLEPGWFENVQVNSYVPQPIADASRDGRIALELGHIAAGKRYLFFLQFQVNPTDVGRRNVSVELDDGQTPLVTIHRTQTVYP
jgi:hypothetical protein